MITPRAVREHERICATLNTMVTPRLRRVYGAEFDRLSLPVVAEFRVSLAETTKTLGVPEGRGRFFAWNYTRPDGDGVYSARVLETGRDDVTLRLCAPDGDGIGFYLFVLDAFSASK